MPAPPSLLFPPRQSKRLFRKARRSNHANDHFRQRSTQKRARYNSGKFFQHSWREADATIGRAARRFLPENPRADDQPTWPRLKWVLQLFRPETCSGPGRGREYLSQKSFAQIAGETLPRLVRTENSVRGDLAGSTSRRCLDGGGGR